MRGRDVVDDLLHSCSREGRRTCSDGLAGLGEEENDGHAPMVSVRARLNPAFGPRHERRN